MKLLEAVDLKPSRSAMERALDEMEWGAIKGENDAFIAVFTAAFRREILHLEHRTTEPTTFGPDSLISKDI